MSSLQYYDEAGAGTENGKKFHYRQAVVIGNIVKCSGQGGWTNDNKLDANDPLGQVDLAFENVDRVLRTVGLRGWEDVYLLRSLHVDMGATYQYVVDKLKQRIPNHRPVWTAIAVPRLGFAPMQSELEVEAYIPDKQ